jgi:hypothetical protein
MRLGSISISSAPLRTSMNTARFASITFLTLGLFAGCGDSGELPSAPTAAEAKAALDAAGSDGSVSTTPGVIKSEGKFGGSEKKVSSPTPAKPD